MADTGDYARLRAQFKSQKKRLDYDVEGLPTLYLRLARQWKRPVKEIKRIVKAPAHSGGQAND